MNAEPTSEASEKPGWPSAILAMFGVVVSLTYLANLSAGFVEIPDNLPIVGNLDEVFFSGVLFASLARLGINLPVGQRRVMIPVEPKRGEGAQK